MKPWEMKFAPQAEDEPAPWERTYTAPEKKNRADMTPEEQIAFINEQIKKDKDKFRRRLESIKEKQQKDNLDAGALVRGAVQGATFDFADEGIAGARSIVEGRPYDEVYAEEQEALKKIKERAPWSYGAGELGGALVGPGGVTMAAGRRILAATPSTTARALGLGATGSAVGTTAELGKQKEKDVAAAATSVPAMVETGLGAAGPVASRAVTAMVPLAEKGASAVTEAWRSFPRHLRETRQPTPTNRMPAVPAPYEGNATTQRVLARKLDKSLTSANIPDRAASTRIANQRSIGGMTDGENTQFLVTAPDATINQYVENVKRSPRVPVQRNTATTTAKELVAPGNRPLGERVAAEFKREAGVLERPETVIAASRNRIRELYDDIQAVREQAGGTAVPGLARSFKASGRKAEEIYNRAAKNMTIDAPGKVEFDSPKFPTFGREYQRRLAGYNAEKRRFVNKMVSKGGDARRAAREFDSDNKDLYPVLLNDNNIPTTVLMELYNDATQLAAKDDTVGRRMLDLFKQRLPGARAGSWAGQFRDHIEDLRILKTAQVDEGAEAVGRGGTLAKSKNLVDFRELAEPRQQQGYRQGMVLEQGELLRNRLDQNPESALRDVVATPGDRDVYDEVVRGGANTGMSPAELQRQAAEIRRRQDIAGGITKAQGAQAFEDASAGPVAELARKAAYSTSYAGVAGLEMAQKLVPEGVRQAENTLLSRNVGGVWDAIERVRAEDLANAARRDQRSLRINAIANALISTYMRPEE